MSRTRLAAASVAVLVSAVVVGALGAGRGGSEPYLVRAVFDNASFVIPGETVKVAGVAAGTIDSLDLTADHHAIVVLRIDDPAMRPFRADAHCRIGLQSLIGEQFVECEPSRKRGGGVAPAPALAVIQSGPGHGQHLLPIAQTTTPVGADLLNTIMRVPERQRLPLIINELGAGLSGNGEALRAALRRASPALQQADRVVKVLADQDATLARLVDESDAVLGPLAARRRDVTGFVRHAGQTATATAQRGDALEADLAKLPAFLRHLGPAADRLGALADQTTPAVDALSSQASSVNAATARLGPLTKQATPALQTLGAVADRGRRTFPKLDALATGLGAVGTPLKPLSKDLAALSSSFDTTGGIEALMRFIYFYTGAVNGEDASGHYTRAGLDQSACIDHASQYNAGCGAKYFNAAAAATAAKAGVAANGAASGRGAAPAASPPPATGRLLDYLLGP
jgi:ABC-type transporter Mla subunit MlaD